ncbi:alpha/beta fold hydrolase [Serratia ureilytica]|uniref:alpha/beta fold hydrolase n=1 Tax=Serratia ureilytica TaxID=300181 RepID=UPI0034C5DB9B
MMTNKDNIVKSKPTVVLLHGAWADGSTWHRIIPLLHSQGINVVAVQSPLTSLKDDIATARRALSNIEGAVILVGWSYGGAVITEIGSEENVRALVYIAAFALSEGTSVGEAGENNPPPGADHIKIDHDGYLTLTLQGFQEHLAPDIDSIQAAIMHATQHPTHSSNFSSTISNAAWKNKPSWYVVCEKDHMIQPDLQHLMAKKIHAKITSIQSGHTPHLSHPDEIANIIIDAVNYVETEL